MCFMNNLPLAVSFTCLGSFGPLLGRHPIRQDFGSWPHKQWLTSCQPAKKASFCCCILSSSIAPPYFFHSSSACWFSSILARWTLLWSNLSVFCWNSFVIFWVKAQRRVSAGLGPRAVQGERKDQIEDEGMLCIMLYFQQVQTLMLALHIPENSTLWMLCLLVVFLFLCLSVP